MAKRDIGTEILQGVQEIKAYKAGQLRLATRRLKNPAPTKEIRKPRASFAGSLCQPHGG